MMTRKNYAAIASAITDAHAQYDLTGGPILTLVALYIADALEVDNPRFQRDKFLDACNIAP